ncbi:MAG: hybrid sensor histidine kinase/response regulator [Myxococcota bacterium]
MSRGISVRKATYLLGSNTDERLERLVSTLDAIDQGLQIIGEDWRYLYVNAAACNHGRTTRDELLGRTMMEAYPGIENTPLFHRLKECMQQRLKASWLNEFTYPDGMRGWFELRIEPHQHGLIIFSSDATERKLLEQQFLHAQKLEAVGRLAGGIAHDFNNLLSIILSCTQLVLDELPADSEQREDLTQVYGAGERAAGLTRQLLAFSRQHVMQPRVLDLNEVVLALTRMLRTLVGEHITMTVEASPAPLVMRADAGSLEQVVMNLVVNARDAMPSGGQLHVRLSQASMWAVLEVRDTGVGMDEKTRERIFEPFFTTKESGRGTGLGLSTVFGIVSQMGGDVSVESAPGAGATFRVRFPLAAGAAPLPGEAQAPVRAAKEGSGRVLVVDDERAVLSLACTILESAGYEVLRASSGSEAVLVASTAGRLDLLVTDVVMPGLSGRELADALRQQRPELKVLYMSGYADDGVLRQRALDAGVELLDKPLLPGPLLERVARLLSA